MNGSRSTLPRPGDRSSLDALNRTIEGLEARLEGLLQPRDPRRQAAPAWSEARSEPIAPPAARTPAPVDPLQEIRDRQRMLAGYRERPAGSHVETVTPPSMARPRLEPRRPAQAHVAQAQTEPSLRDIAEALVGLRQELKHDIAEGVAREMDALRTDVSGIHSAAQGQPIDQDLRSELSRLADSINVLGQRGGPATDALRAEYEELHAVIDGLAREESIQRLDTRWQGLEERIVELDTHDLREELVGLAYRIDDIKSQLGSMSDSPTIRALEQKLLTVATAMEQLGTRMQPNDSALNSQFALLDDRLDEISRAIAASGRAASASTTDHTLQRLENRLGSLAQQIDTMASGTNGGHTSILSERIEALSERIDQLSEEQVSLRLEERLDQLSHMLSKTSKPHDLTEYLADISDKIDRLGHGAVNESLLERLDQLAHRIEAIGYQDPLQPAVDLSAFDRIEDRLSGIAARLDETARAPSGDTVALRDLESQIAHLSTLISQPSSISAAYPAAREMEDRMAAIETHMTTNDEYVLEAARQAAEAVLESFARQGNGSGGAGAPSVDMAAVTALAEDLRHIEELTRNTEERSQHTLNALHRTLVQIADRLDTMEDRIAGPMLHAPAQQAAPAWQQAPERHNNPAFASALAPAAEVENLHHDLMDSLANGTSHAGAPATSEPVFGTRGIASTSETVDAHGDVQGDVHGELRGDDTMVAPEEPVSGMARTEKNAPKGGLLSQISKRLRPGQKIVASKPGRTVVDPAPPLAPMDMLPPEQENEPLEPGSGAPDVRKILERVRASQAAAGTGNTQAKDSDQADYIAAARRAAKAAALETDPALGANAARAKKADAGKTDARTSSGSAFAKHRRPILMAVGAVLLVLMTLPLVKTLTSGEEAPQPPAISKAPVVEDSNAVAPPAADAVASTQPQSAPVAPLPTELTDGTPPLEPAMSEAAPQPTPDVAASAPQAAAQPIVVPASLSPKSLADAAEAGDPVALFEIGARYTEGRGVAPDLSEAANWYKLAADRGFAPAQYRVANLFEKGTGVTRDIEKALSYYRQSAEAGNASAMHNLAVLHASGANGEPNYAEAVEWFKKAAEHGVSDSQFNLAILYARGNGVPQDLGESYKWFAIAAKGGDQDASEKRDDVANAMRKEPLDAARAAANSWKPKPLNPDANEVTVPDEWANGKPLTTASVDMEKAVLNIQAILNKNGFDAGTPDGKIGQKTVGAIKAFQSSVGQEPDGRINEALVAELLKRNT